MVRKGTKPWSDIRRSDPDAPKQKKLRQEMEREIEREHQQMIRGDIEPEEKR